MDINNLIGTVVTVVFFVFFLGIIWWAYGGNRKDRFEEDGRIPFEGEDEFHTDSKLGDK